MSAQDEEDRRAGEVWASEAKILEAADALGEWISTYSQGMTHARAEYPAGMLELMKLAVSLELRVKSYHWRAAGVEGTPGETQP